MEEFEDENVDEVLEENENEEMARNIMEGKRRASTRQMYRNRIRALTTWIRESHPDVFDFENDCIKLPIPPNVIMEFMAKVSTIEDKRTKEKRQASVSVIGSYRSSIAMLYEEQNIRFDDETMIAFNKLIAVYKQFCSGVPPGNCTTTCVQPWNSTLHQKFTDRGVYMQKKTGSLGQILDKIQI